MLVAYRRTKVSGPLSDEGESSMPLRENENMSKGIVSALTGDSPARFQIVAQVIAKDMSTGEMVEEEGVIGAHREYGGSDWEIGARAHLEYLRESFKRRILNVSVSRIFSDTFLVVEDEGGAAGDGVVFIREIADPNAELAKTVLKVLKERGA